MFMSHLNQYLWKNNRYGSMFGIYCFLSNYYSKLCMSKMIIPRRFDSLMIQLSSINLERLDLKKPSHRKNLSEPAALQALIIIKHYQLSNVQQYLMLSKFAQFRQKAIHQTPTTHFKNSQKEPEVTQPQQMKNNNSQERATEQRRKRRLSINQENRVNFNRQKYTRVKSLKQQDYSPLKLGKSLVCKSVNKAKDEEKQHLYKKTSNLKLTDYLTLYSMSKRSQSSKSKSKLNNQIKLLVPQPKSNCNMSKSHANSLPNETNYSHQKSETQHHNLVLHHQQLKDLRENRLSSPISNSKLKFAIDTQESIKVVRQETKKSLMQTKKELSTFLETISHSHDIRSDQESLVFMCNVLHIFEDKITQSVKLAQQLIEERNKQKNVRGDKSPSSNSMIRKSRNKKNRSEISETSDYGVK